MGERVNRGASNQPPVPVEQSVEEIGVADPHERLLRWFDVAGERYEETDASRLLGITTADLSGRIDWPG